MNKENTETSVVEYGNFSQLAAMKEATKGQVQTVDTSRVIREVETALMVAKARPRDEVDAWTNVMKSCKRLSFAEKSIYSYVRGGEKVEGPSIRLAEALARCFGNLDYGWRELERSAGKSTIEAYCWDLETNTKSKKTFDVIHMRDTKQGKKPLASERDIYEHLANYSARRVRACILSVIPADLIEDAINECKKSMSSGVNAGNKVEYAKKVVLLFEEIGVTHDMLKKFLGIEKVVGATEKQLIELRQIYTSIKEGHASVKEFFNFEEPFKSSGNKEADLIKKLENPADNV